MTVLDRYSDSHANALAADRAERSRISEAHARSKQPEKAPRGLYELLAWFRARFTEEVPDAIHGAALWRDYASRSEPRYRPQGGSLLGTPADDDGFRRLLYNSPKELEVSEYDGHKAREGDEHFARPMRAALFRVGPLIRCERHGGTIVNVKKECDNDERSHRAAFLFRVAASGFDWYAPSLSLGVPPHAARVYAEDALFVLWKTYDLVPREAVA